ncbi:MAG: hypothetical protein ABW221_11520 [Vicinamibacteria bacterium]
MRTPAFRWLSFAVLGLLSGASRAAAGDVTVFATIPSPSDQWNRGYGAALTSTWFQAINLEGEAARMPGDVGNANMTSFTGSALLAPPLGAIVPYGGVGIGLFRQTVGSTSDTGVLRCFVLGLKVKLGLALVKGEYRRISLSGEPLLPMDRRISFGAGVSF